MDDKILIVGEINAYYRSELWVKVSLSKNYSTVLVSRNYYKIGNSRIFNALSYVLIVVELFFKCFFTKKVILLPMNHNLITVILSLKKIFRFELITDLYVSKYETELDRKGTLNNFRSSYTKLLDRLIIEKSDTIVHISSHELNTISKRVDANLNNSKVKIIKLATPDRGLATRDERNKSFNVCWWGTYVPLHGIEKILNASLFIKQNNDKIKVFLFGVENSKKEPILEFIKNNNLGDVVVLHTQYNFSNGKLSEFLRENCDLALGIFGDSNKAKNTIPNKIIDSFSFGIPVLSMYTKSIDEYFGNLVQYCENTPEDMYKQIVNHKMNQETDRSKIYFAYKKNHTLEICAKQMEKTIFK